MRSIDLDVLHEENADLYWDKSEDHDFAVQLNFGQPPINHFCRVLEKWVQHFLGAQVRVTPMQQITDPKWSWHVGLDAAEQAGLQIADPLQPVTLVGDARPLHDDSRAAGLGGRGR